MRRHLLALTINHFAVPCLALLAMPCTLAAQQPATDSTPARARTDTLTTVRVTVLRTPVAATRAPYAVSTVTSREATAARPGFALDEVLGGVGGCRWTTGSTSHSASGSSSAASVLAPSSVCAASA